jgi:UDP-GlcNAc:undecaprenyl-phosphate GlcNAc-1-phosphate transferase
LLTTRVVRAAGHRLRAYGKAHGAREQGRIPRLGGISVVVATLAAWGVLLLVPNAVRASFLAEWRTLVLIMIPGSLILVLGAYDDLVGAVPRVKLAVETLAAGLVWWAGFRIVNVPILGYEFRSPVLSFVLTVFWILAVTNALNLIDGLDGLAAGIAFFVTASVFVVSLIQGNRFVCVMAVTLGGALLGFLRYNYSPATIYLGDCGSLFLGFFLGTLAIHSSQKSSTLLALVVPFVAFGLPLMDTALSVVRRFLNVRPVFGADQDHIHHRLQRELPPHVAVLLLYALGALFSLGSILIVHSTENLVAMVAVLAGASGWFLKSKVQYEELSELNVYVSRAMRSQRRVLANQILIRKASKLLEEATSLGSCWKVLADTLEALDFDGASCQLSRWPIGRVPSLDAWSRSGQESSHDNWSVSIPLRAGDIVVGELQVCRALSKERLLFQFSSLLDTLMPPFEMQLKKLYDAQEKELAERTSVGPSRPMRRGLLASNPKG